MLNHGFFRSRLIALQRLQNITLDVSNENDFESIDDGLEKLLGLQNINLDDPGGVLLSGNGITSISNSEPPPSPLEDSAFDLAFDLAFG